MRAMTAPSAVLVCNAGSSSLKAELLVKDADWRSESRIVVERIGTSDAALRAAAHEPTRVDAPDHRAAAKLVLDRLQHARSALDDLVATGHRVVHGGERFRAPAVVTDEVRAELEQLGALAPLHNPPALDVLREVSSAFPRVPAVAAFDTAFFADLPEPARTYALPTAWRERYGIRRFGFHGIAHEYLSRRHAELCGDPRRAQRVLTLQLGQGCSITALRDGTPVETSMGYTPLEGLVMGTRPGDVDAGAIVRLMHLGVRADEIDTSLQRESGLRGLSGTSDDVRELLELEARSDRGATLALEVFCQRIRKYLGAYAAVLGGVDAVVFGGGIGEHQPVLRSRICAGFGWLGLELDESANRSAVGREARITGSSSPVAAWVIPVSEELAIARAALALVRG